MKNITLTLTIVLGFCATEAEAQERGLGSLRERRALLEQQRAEAAKAAEANLSPEARALREKKETEGKAERELWSTWPEDVRYLDANIIKACEQELNVIFNGADNDGWVQGCGKCLIDRGGAGRSFGVPDFWNDFWKKFNSDGVLIQAGRCADFKEYIWMTNCAACVTIELRTQWAKEHGMTYEGAVRKGGMPRIEKQQQMPKKTLLGKREKQIVEALRKVCEAEKAKEEK